ncbi:MAG: T9SS type A sorting domain-containing protein [Chitinophagales bacterium]
MKNSCSFLISLFVFLFQSVYSQLPHAIEWQKSFGGSNNDEARSIQQTTDNGFIVAGFSSSNNDDVTGNHNDNDFWIVKLDADGNLVWQKSLGGSASDQAYSIQQTTDGGYIVAGSSNSNDGDVSGHHGSLSYTDYWVVRLDASGNLVWQKSLGGSNDELASSVQQTADGGFIVAGDSWSTDGDVTGHHGSTSYNDYWIVKLDAGGNLIWQKSFGGSDFDFVHSVQQTNDGGFLNAGDTYSDDGDVSGNHGGFDYWIIKLDTAGNLTWQKSLGGSDADFAESFQQTSNGGFIIGGISYSIDGDVSGNHGGYDVWIVKLDAEGNLVWEKSFGGSNDDGATSLQLDNDGGFIVSGFSDSNDGDVSGNHDLDDYWIVKIDTAGNLTWQKSLGGSYNDEAHSIQQTNDGGFIVAGNSYSDDGDVSGNHGGEDYWIFKLSSDTLSGIGNLPENEILVYPNPVQNLLAIDLGNQINNPIISVYDLQGRKIECGMRTADFGNKNSLQLSTGNLPDGFYTLQIVDKNSGKTSFAKFVKSE